MSGVSLLFADSHFRLLPCGALFWPAENALLVADLHLEKGSAFARRGWLLPPYDSLDTLNRISAALRATAATRLFALGDSFHDANGPSRLGDAAGAQLRAILQLCEICWITGNHDGDSGASLGGRAVAELEVAGIMLRHEAQRHENSPEISGHFHPKVVLELRTGRRISRRCIAATDRKLVLPAYGAYAGGLDVGDPAFVAALGAAPDALLPAAGKLLRIAARQEKFA